MLNKWKFFAISALILMIVVAPYFVKAQTQVTETESALIRSNSIVTPTFDLANDG